MESDPHILLTPLQGWTAVIGALATAISGVYILWVTKGSKARIAEMKARHQLQQADLTEMTAAYEAERTENNEHHKQEFQGMKREHEVRMAQMQTHIEILDKKLDACEEHHRECVGRAGHLEGKLEALQQQIASACIRMDAINQSKDSTG